MVRRSINSSVRCIPFLSSWNHNRLSPSNEVVQNLKALLPPPCQQTEQTQRKSDNGKDPEIIEVTSLIVVDVQGGETHNREIEETKWRRLFSAPNATRRIQSECARQLLSPFGSLSGTYGWNFADTSARNAERPTAVLPVVNYTSRTTALWHNHQRSKPNRKAGICHRIFCNEIRMSTPRCGDNSYWTMSSTIWTTGGKSPPT